MLLPERAGHLTVTRRSAGTALRNLFRDLFSRESLQQSLEESLFREPL